DLDAVEYRLWPGPDSILTNDRFFVAPEETTTYVVTAIDADGCEAIATAEVIVDKFARVYVPNVFSPNKDGTNDLFEIYTDQSVVSISDFAIYERWGAEVYRFPGPVGPNETGWGWDGRDKNGKLYMQHVYVYSVLVTFQNGQELAIKGDVLLLWPGPGD
ncbi:MAG: gliding motility-associated C-terminal domain-containing protein, partial [Bacteroidota bacterium]